MNQRDYIKLVSERALSGFETTMQHLGLADGKRQGREYLPLNPKRADSKPGSFSINQDTGAWADFATDDKGGDLVGLGAYLWSCHQSEAAERLGEFLGLPKPDLQESPARAGNTTRRTNTPAKPGKPSSTPPDAKASGDGWVCVMPVPGNAPKPPQTHSSHGKPSRRYAYTTGSGEVNFYHDRYEAKKEGDRKQFSPLTLWRSPVGKLEWKFKASPAPRPLYGLTSLASFPDVPALLVEGEKAAEAAALLLPNNPVLTWQGGAQAVDKADFAPLAGRVVWIWPDNDEAGKKAASALVKSLRAAGSKTVRMVNLDLLAQTPGIEDGRPTLTPGPALEQGDDAADLVARHWTAEHFSLLLESADVCMDPEGNSKTVKPKQERPPKNNSAEPVKRSFFVDEGGVYLIAVREGAYLPPKWICSRLDVLAKVRSPDNRGWGLMVALSDPDGVKHRINLPMSLFNGEGLEVAGLLLDRGLNLAPKGRPALVEYLQTAEAKARIRVTARTGWHEGVNQSVFVLPTMAFGEGSEQWILETGEPGGNTFKQRGTLEEWKLHVSALCRGNSRLLFAVSMAYASSLLYLTGAESGGFHYRADSSSGKTTALRVAASVCGGADFMQRWKTTDNAIETLAMQHCDAPMFLDELEQVDSRIAGEMAYMLANGSGKARATRTGGARARASWRLLFLSSGEIGLIEHMAGSGKTTRAGQELRIAEIPADAGAGLGAFENLHGNINGNGSEFAKALESAARKYYGTALVAFLEKLAQHQAEIPASLKEAQKQFEKTFLTNDAGGQARRVAGRFALVGAAGELATEWGITGWDPGEAMQAAVVCFNAWLSGRGGEGNREQQAMLDKVREFLELHGEARFTDFDRPVAEDNHASRVINKAGFRKHRDGLTEYFIYPGVFKKEVCKGYDFKSVSKLLAGFGYIKLDGKRTDPKVTLPGEGQKRVFHILPTIWDDDNA